MIINKQQRLNLHRQCHHLKPVILLGTQGYTEAVAAEIECALNAHGLIKVKVNTANKVSRNTLTQTLCDQHQATLIQCIGQTVCIYRPQPQDDT